MLRQLRKVIIENNQDALRELVRDGKALDRLQDSLKGYLTQLGTDGLSESDAVRHAHVLDFAVNPGHAGDIIERGLADAAAHKAKRALVWRREEAADLSAFLGRVVDDLKLATSAFMAGDPRSAQQLLAAKRQLNAIERTTGRDHLARLETREPGELEASTLYLAILRDLRRVNSHVSSIAYDVLGLIDTRESGDELPARRVDHIGIDTTW
jgi:phosphate:Na+ symporter